MKVSKLFSIDSNLAELLSKEPARSQSSIINTLLEQYYDEYSSDFKRKLADLKQKNAEIRKKMREIKRKIGESAEKDMEKLKFLRHLRDKTRSRLSPESLQDLRKLEEKYGT